MCGKDSLEDAGSVATDTEARKRDGYFYVGTEDPHTAGLRHISSEGIRTSIYAAIIRRTISSLS